MVKPERYTILAVDDEPHVLESMGLNLRRHFEVLKAGGGEEALKILREHQGIAVIISDMRMPGMDGAALLKQSAKIAPGVVRMLLTGHAEMEAAIAAVNEGRIFRFLTKPCPPDQLIQNLNDGVEQYRLMRSEKELLNKTLDGSIQLLTEIMSLVDSTAFGRSNHIRLMARAVVRGLGQEPSWQLDLAAMLARIGSMTIPPEVREKHAARQFLNAEERQMVESAPEIGYRLLSHIPRLEQVAAIIRHQARPYAGGEGATNLPQRNDIPLESRVLHALLDLTDAEAHEKIASDVLEEMETRREGEYDPQILKALRDVINTQDAAGRLVRVPVAELHVGDILRADLITDRGQKLLAAGNRISETFLVRIEHYASLFTMSAPILVERPPELDK